MSVEQIAARLTDLFRLLTGGNRTALPRHQTLRAAIDWSYDLLTEAERVLLRRLSVFSGGWTLEGAEGTLGRVVTAEGFTPSATGPGAEAIGVGEGIEANQVLDLIFHLVEKSLVISRASPGAA